MPLLRAACSSRCRCSRQVPARGSEAKAAGCTEGPRLLLRPPRQSGVRAAWRAGGWRNAHSKQEESSAEIRTPGMFPAWGCDRGEGVICHLHLRRRGQSKAGRQQGVTGELTPRLLSCRVTRT